MDHNLSTPPLPHSPSPKKNLVRGCLELPRSIFPTSKGGTKATNPQLRRFFSRFFADVVPMGVSSLGFTTSKASCTSMLSWEPWSLENFVQGFYPGRLLGRPNVTTGNAHMETKFPDVYSIYSQLSASQIHQCTADKISFLLNPLQKINSLHYSIKKHLKIREKLRKLMKLVENQDKIG